ncbi:MAG: phosphatase PAP2 family protein [Roseburia sp.]|nr:phosphatase PAP2 family protein [Roseburia sp.]
MTKEQYIKITEPLREDPEKTKWIVRLNQILTGVVFLLYPLYVAVLFCEKNPSLLKVILVPAVSFVLVTIFRKVLNAPRPYEKFDIPPVIEKDTRGKSFPSRHVFSVFIIAMAIFYLYPGPGILIGLIGVAMAVIRVYGGVHEPRDVIAGALVGLACGIIGFYLI